MVDQNIYRPGLGRNYSLVQQLKEYQLNPKSLVFVSLAESYRAEGMAHQALEVLEEGLVHHPALASAHIARAKCLFDLKRYAESQLVLRELLKANPDNLRAQKLMAEIFVRLGQRRAAIRALTKVVSLFPQDKEAVRALEELENLETGQNILVKHVSRASTDMAPEKVGKLEEFHVGTVSQSFAAIGALEKSSERLDSFAQEDNQEQDELPAAEPLVEDTTEPTFATRTIAELYLRQGLKEKAKKVLQKLLRDDPLNQWARETLQELRTDGILAPPAGKSKDPILAKKAKVLEQMLARVRLLKNLNT